MRIDRSFLSRIGFPNREAGSDELKLDLGGIETPTEREMKEALGEMGEALDPENEGSFWNQWRKLPKLRKFVALAFSVGLPSLAISACAGLPPEQRDAPPTDYNYGPEVIHTPQETTSTAQESTISPTTAEVEPQASATPPTLEQMAVGGGINLADLEPTQTYKLEILREVYFERHYDADGDGVPDGPILSEIGENTIRWAIDNVTPYFVGKEINDKFGRGTETVALESGFTPGEPFFASVGGANRALEAVGKIANAVHLVVIDSTHIVAIDSNSQPVAQLSSTGNWEAVSDAVATEATAETPEQVQPPTETPTSTPEPPPYSHITTAPNGAPLQEYLDASGDNIKPATYLGGGAWELVPAGVVLPTHVYEPDTGWREVDPNKTPFERVTTSNWFVARGSEGTIFEDLAIPIRVTTTDFSTLRSFEYTPALQEHIMSKFWRIIHLTHTYQNQRNGEAVDFETYLQMIKDGDPKAQIGVWEYTLKPNGQRDKLVRRMVDPTKGITFQFVRDEELLDNNPLATVANPDNVMPRAFILGATDAGQLTVVVSIHPAGNLDELNHEERGRRLMAILLSEPISAMDFVAEFSSQFEMMHPTVDTGRQKDIRDTVVEEVNRYSDELGLTIETLKYPFPEWISSIDYD